MIPRHKYHVFDISQQKQYRFHFERLTAIIGNIGDGASEVTQIIQQTGACQRLGEDLKKDTNNKKQTILIRKNVSTILIW